LTTVVALGGNALIRPGDRGTAAEQATRLREAAGALAALFAEPRLVITHGNGPQVGNVLLRQERAADEVPPLPLYLAVAQTQAEIGALIEAELGPVAGRPVACLLTHVVVAEDDPAFDRATKPIGPFYSAEQARSLEQERGWTLVEEHGRGWRRAVPSPEPLEVVELAQIRSLLDSGALAVACGGGGIPVVRRDGRIQGAEAVIDKDRASALLAASLGVPLLVLSTGVEQVAWHFRQPDQRLISSMTAEEATRYLDEGEFPRGSMGPKIEAAVDFLARGGDEVLITTPAALGRAIAGQTGTRIVPTPQPAPLGQT
jgi:carbamate kinase